MAQAAAPAPAQARGRKRSRPGEDLESLLEQLEVAVTAGSTDLRGLWQAQQRLQYLQADLERRLTATPIDNLTPHAAVEFIYRRRVRLVHVNKNDFSSDEEESEEPGPKPPGSKPPKEKREKGTGKELVVQFQVGKDKVVVTCKVETPPGGDPMYTFDIRRGGKGEQQALLRCCSWDEAETRICWEHWQAMRAKFDVDKRQLTDFARAVTLLGMVSELQRRYAKEESDSEDELPGLVTTISICGQMADAAMPTMDSQLALRLGVGLDEPDGLEGQAVADAGPTESLASGSTVPDSTASKAPAPA